jgi:hypothetical protein
MSTESPLRDRAGDGVGPSTPRVSASPATGHRRTTETKASFKTTEFFTYLAVLAGIIIAGLIVDNAGDGGFGASKVWLYATILTVGYMVSRGLAKSGSRDPYWDDDGGRRDGR